MNQEEREILSGAAAELGVELAEGHLDLLEIYLEELHIWNRRMNLIGLRSRKRILVELLADSLVPVSWLPHTGKMLDVGSGAGLPGIPLKVLRPGLRVDLLEPSAKKLSFLKQVLRLLGLEEIRAIRGRAESPGLEIRPGSYDIVTARAVAGLELAVSMCAPYIKSEGLFLGFLGDNAEKELARATPALGDASLRLRDSLTYRLPGGKGQRRVVLFAKGVIY